jgi:hypothetical protein
MSKSLQVLAVWSLIVTGLMVGDAPANAQSSAVVFQGLTHTAVGAATLRLDPSREALDVSGLGPAGDDGIALKQEGMTSWTTRIAAAVPGSLPLSLSWSALADGRRIGSALIQQTGANLEISAVFTGATTRPTYSGLVYNHGVLVDAIGGLPPTAHFFMPFDVCRKVPEFCEFTIEFHTLADGACLVKAVSPKTGPFRLPNGAIVTGNELRLVEEVHAGSAYPYIEYDEVVMQSNAYSLAIFSESVR